MAQAISLRMAAESNVSAYDNSPLIYVPVYVFFVLCPLFVSTRVWSRLKASGKLGPEDYTIMVSLAFALASGGIMLAGVHYGYGKHVASLSPTQKYESFKYFYLCQITYKSSINLTKASILLLYLRIFSGINWFRWVCMFVLTSVVMYCIATVMATIFQCIPIEGAFDKTLGAKCIDNGRFWYANSGFSISTDVIILILPMPLVYSLQISRAQKIALVAVFALGVFVVITSTLRLTTIDIQATTIDPLYDVSSTMWTIIEMNVAVICACLPQIRPLVVKIFPKMTPTHSPYSRRAENSENSERRFSKPYRVGSSHHRSEASSKWSYGLQEAEGISLSNIEAGVGVGDRGSEESILHQDRPVQIQKTVQYSVEYSKDKKTVPGDV